MHEWTTHLPDVTALAADPAGRHVVVASPEALLRLDALSGVVVDRVGLPRELFRLGALQVGSDGAVALAIHQEATQDRLEHVDLLLWAPGTALRRIDVRALEPGHEADARWDQPWALAPAGHALAYAWSTSEAGRVVVRDFQSLEVRSKRKFDDPDFGALAFEGDTLAVECGGTVTRWAPKARARTWAFGDGASYLSIGASATYVPDLARRACWVLSSRATYGVELPELHAQADFFGVDTAAETIAWFNRDRFVEQRLADAFLRISAVVPWRPLARCGPSAALARTADGDVARRALPATWTEWKPC